MVLEDELFEVQSTILSSRYSSVTPRFRHLAMNVLSFSLLWLSFLPLCGSKKTPIDLTDDLLHICGPNKLNKRQQQELKWIIAATSRHAVLNQNSPQQRAACELLGSGGRSQARLLQRYALVVLHYTTNRTAWTWTNAVDEPHLIPHDGYWMSLRDECTWYGVTCNTGGTIRGLELGFLELQGILPRELGLLSQLRTLDLHGNELQGVLPPKALSQWPKLEYLYLQMNGLFGALQREVQELTSLTEMRLFGNFLRGTIPTGLGSLSKLQVVDLYANFLTGTIPTELGQLKGLKSLDLHDNDLVGRVPDEICRLGLEELVVDCLGPRPEVICTCCTKCCRGLPNAQCEDVDTKVKV